MATKIRLSDWSRLNAKLIKAFQDSVISPWFQKLGSRLYTISAVLFFMPAKSGISGHFIFYLQAQDILIWTG